jgi:DNA-binding transcriptional regulator YhcF (GntR family)
LSTFNGEEMNDELKKQCIDKLKAIDISDEEIEKWLA